jgi:hypothetical protein
VSARMIAARQLTEGRAERSFVLSLFFLKKKPEQKQSLSSASRSEMNAEQLCRMPLDARARLPVELALY